MSCLPDKKRTYTLQKGWQEEDEDSFFPFPTSQRLCAWSSEPCGSGHLPDTNFRDGSLARLMIELLDKAQERYASYSRPFLQFGLFHSGSRITKFSFKEIMRL